MRSIVVALGLAALAVTPMWLGAGCAAGGQTSTTSTGHGASSHGSSSNTQGTAGHGGHAGQGGTGGGTAGAAGHGGGVCVPSEELCDGKDNNCDGVVDEGCPCKEGDTQSCYSGAPSTQGVGECKAGTSTCDIHGVWGACIGEVTPTAETCDGLDNDCNGTIDEGLGYTTCGVGACQTQQDNCVDGKPAQCKPGNPVTEKCDGVDNNCDGFIDEGCACQDGKVQGCYTGPPSTMNVGACHAGTQTCTNGQWGPCSGDVVPTNETCNAVDDDCDGTVDDGLGTSTCGVGACVAMVQNCVGGNPQTCVPGQPSNEICDGIDNDCNGQVDDGLGTISCGLGACTNTVPSCVNGKANTCSPLQAQAETCNGIDDNCNGIIDDGDPGGGSTCDTGQQGVCAAGTIHCTGGSLQCTQNVQSSAETCDGKDNDCNGQVDDGNPGGGVACNTGKPGVCATGTTACQNGGITCVQDVQPTAEVCDGFDNNCNGGVDEGNPGGGVACDTGKLGVCAAGTTACVGGTIACNQNLQPATEVCDGKDNNCDGQVDEGDPGGGQACNTGKKGVCAAGITACQNGATVCTETVQPSAETCDGKDNDCDGQIDNGNPGGGVPCSTGKLGVCAAGHTACQNGSVVCVQDVQASAEICDGLDNNCDGQVDEGVKTTFYADVDGDTYGNPSVTVAACTAPAGYVANNTDCNDSDAAVHPGAAEVCNGVDDNCNGTIDEGVKTRYYADADGDGYGNPSLAVSVEACTQPTGYVLDNTDCNDTKSTVHPGATETCNGVDDNCNGQTDEGNPGSGAACDTGKKGVCAAGTTACTGGQVVCNQNVQPSAEVCDGLDNNCDGQVDEGNPGGNLACSTGKQGVCAAGTTACTAGAIKCNQNVQPSAEMCDGLDNNCDGQVDEGNPGGGQACNTGLLGVCAAGTTACQSGTIKCNQNVQPAAETCDGLDNNCNGQVDEGVKNTYYADTDRDGYGNPTNNTQACTPPTGYVSNNGDCNDNDATVHPGATETCNGVDDNCNGTIDEGVKTTYYADADGDGYGNAAATTQACSKPTGYVTDATDCNDTNNAIHPGATETCNGVDDNCNGTIDEGNPGGGVACTTGQLGVCSPGTTACTGGALVCNRNVNPSAEVCDGLDNDCNGVVDDGVKTTYYRDADGDGYGNPGVSQQACTQPSGYVTNNTDCNDASAAVHPGATETCNGIDDNCNGTIDENVKTTYYADADGDGYGNPTISQQACSKPTGYVTDATDCNDNNNAIHPGATEVCNGADDNCNGTTDEGNPGGGVACNTGLSGVCAAGTTACQSGAIKCNQNVQPTAEVCDGLDNDCDGVVDDGVKTTYYRDSDGDTYGDPATSTQACSKPTGYVTNNTDCNDTNAAVHPGATEVCNGIDDNCDGQIDEGVKTTYYRDADSDGYGSASNSTQACTQPAGYVTNSTDCNDANAAIKPGATEVCDGVDNNCDGQIDEGVKTTYYADADGDGYGNPSISTQACTKPTGYVTNSTDCNDSNNAVHPGATEVCNGVDDNCSGTIDEGNPGGGVACTTGQLGVCSPGTTACTGGALVCNRNVNPSAEVCDGLDNNCNGLVDDGVLTTYYRDADSDGYGNAGVTTQACTQPAGYVTNSTDCNDNNASIHPGATEVCNGADDNCNGTVDEGNPGGGVACSTGQAGVCAAGTTACTAGAIVCNRNVNPSTETCNSLDDNCDGYTDNALIADGNPNSCASAANKTVSVAYGGTTDVSGYVDASGDDWFVVNFAGVPGTGGYYHPKITFASNPGTQFSLQVFTACGTTAAGCTGNLQTFEMSYPDNPNGCNWTNGGFTCSDGSGKPTQFIVHVQRTAGTNSTTNTCSAYTVRMTDI